MAEIKKNINSVLKEVLLLAKPSEKEMKEIKEKLQNFLKKTEQSKRKCRINADIFVGGSFAKKTIIKKDSYDIDIFIRFDKKYKDELLSNLTEKMLAGERAVRVHGSRDYFKISTSNNLFFEIVPVKFVKNPKEAENITDLSYSHVNYIKRKVKSERILDEILLAKAFCYANGVYGAESYVSGFSGYALELLIYHYKGFIKFLKEITKVNIKNKIIIDIEKSHKNKNHILIDINEAKLKSPIILIDPTYKQRNVLAALSEETFKNFQKSCTAFLKKPSIDFFRQKVINIEKLKKEAKNKGYEFILLQLTTAKQEGDIAGSKLLKFHRHLKDELSKFFDIKAKGFEYSNKKTA
ncbi:MAG: nucleotidyltransferase domain-containing protein, partial [Candidatus Pacearchaeota archaeon]|nr:nucleotidyltransferase domain-containing protein [Candidatus Pacearchaeota archaeon]